MKYEANTKGYNAFALTTPEIDYHFRFEPFAKQLWQHCLMKPHYWVFRRTDLMNYFGVGKKRWFRATKFLRNSGLLKVTPRRDRSGRIFTREMVFITWDQAQHNNAAIGVAAMNQNDPESPNKSNDSRYRTSVPLSKNLVKGALYLSGGDVRGGNGGVTASDETTMSDHDRHAMRDSFLSRFPGQHTFQTFCDAKVDKSLAKVLYRKDYLLDDLNDMGAGIFFTVNECDGLGRTAANVVRVRAVFVDLDGAPLEPVIPHNPHIVVESSPGRFHAYWLTEDFPPEGFRQAQELLAEMFNGDRSVKDLPRVMRLPGYFHRKHKPFLSRTLLQNYHRPLSYRDFVTVFPPKPRAQFSAPRFQRQNRPSRDDWKGPWGAPAGERNTGLARFCGWMLSRQYSSEEFEADANRWGKSCNPPLSDAEIAQTVKSVSRYGQC